MVTSRVPVHQLYAPATWQEPSALWSLFDGVVYLGLLSEADTQAVILQTTTHPQRDLFSTEDVAFIRHLAGRHPDLLTITCEHVYDWYRAGGGPLDQAGRTKLTRQVYEAAMPLCLALWESTLAAGPVEQEVLWTLVQGRQPISDDQVAVLHQLERRGLVERNGYPWRIFAEIMRQFVQQQREQRAPVPRPAQQDGRELNGGHGEATSVFAVTVPLAVGANEAALMVQEEPELPPAFTHLEGEVFAYLQAHAGVVCDREAIKRAIWQDTPPSDSALQKIIERIRDKIEPDPRNPRRLIAVRGQGYMLRLDGA